MKKGKKALEKGKKALEKGKKALEKGKKTLEEGHQGMKDGPWYNVKKTNAKKKPKGPTSQDACKKDKGQEGF